MRRRSTRTTELNDHGSLARPVIEALALGMMLAAMSGFGTALGAAHKGRRSHPPMSLSDTAPDTTSTIVSKVPGTATGPATGFGQGDEPVPPPFSLPTTSRAQMRACSEKWQQMKMDGEVGEEIWRRFATNCLTAANKAAEKAPR